MNQPTDQPLNDAGWYDRRGSFLPVVKDPVISLRHHPLLPLLFNTPRANVGSFYACPKAQRRRRFEPNTGCPAIPELTLLEQDAEEAACPPVAPLAAAPPAAAAAAPPVPAPAGAGPRGGRAPKPPAAARPRAKAAVRQGPALLTPDGNPKFYHR